MKLKPVKKLPMYMLDAIKKDLNSHYGEFAKNENYLDDVAFRELNDPDGDTLPLYPFKEGGYIDEDVLINIVFVYWYWKLEEEEAWFKDQTYDPNYLIQEYLLPLIEHLKEDAREIIKRLDDQSVEENDEEEEFILDELSGKTLAYDPKATLEKALKRIPGAKMEHFIREEGKTYDKKTGYRFIDTSFGSTLSTASSELKRRGYKLSDITVTGDDEGDYISMSVDSILAIEEFLKERRYETQLENWKEIFQESKVLSEIKRRSDLIFYL